MTTVELSAATQVNPDLLLKLLDAGLFRGAVRLVRGQPRYEPRAVTVVQQAAELADQAAAGTITATEAWFRLRGMPA